MLPPWFLSEPVVIAADSFAAFVHRNQTRKYTGEPYIGHPRHVAKMAAEYGLGVSMVTAALLHDTVEDCEVPVQLITDLFGVEVAALVWGVTKRECEGNRATRSGNETGRLAAETADVQTLKLLDIISNVNGLTAKDPKFAAVYLKEKRAVWVNLTKADLTIHADTGRVLTDEETVLRTLTESRTGT